MKHSFPHICYRADEKNFKPKKKQYYTSKFLFAITVDQMFNPTFKLKYLLLDIYDLIICIQTVKSSISFSNSTKVTSWRSCGMRLGRRSWWFKYTLRPLTVWDTLVFITRTVFIFWHLQKNFVQRVTNVQSRTKTFWNSRENIVSSCALKNRLLVL